MRQSGKTTFQWIAMMAYLGELPINHMIAHLSSDKVMTFRKISSDRVEITSLPAKLYGTKLTHIIHNKLQKESL